MDANSIKNKTFVKSRHLAEEVEAYLQEVATAFEEVEKKNEDLEKKMVVLARKLQEYRDDEDNLRNTLIHAQRLADTLLKEAKQKAEITLKDAQIKAEALVSTTQTKIEQKENQLKTMQKEVNDFKTELLSQYKKHLELITTIPETEFEEEEIEFEANSEAEKTTESAVSEIEEVEEIEPVEEKEEPKKFDFSNMELEEEFTQH